MLEIDGVRASYHGDDEVLHGVSLTVPAGAVTVLLGANGAGKSTTLRAVVGSVRRTAGRVLLDGEELGTDVAANVRRGVVLVPEGGRAFGELTVGRNLRLGAFTLDDDAEIARRRDDVFTLFPRLHDRVTQVASTLSGGERQMLAIGRALMARPQVLLLDEPFLGLAPVIVDAVLDTIERINQDAGITVLVVEQNSQVLRIADHAAVMRLGEVVLREDDPTRLLDGDGADELAQAFIG